MNACISISPERNPGLVTATGRVRCSVRVPRNLSVTGIEREHGNAMESTKLREHGHNNLDLLRLFFASVVIFSHAFDLRDNNRSHEPLTQLFGTLNFGEIAVSSFFILSGFLITGSWLRNPTIVPYLRKRILRIYPGFIVASLVCVLLVGPLGAASTVGFFADLHPLSVLRAMLLLSEPPLPPVFQGSFHAKVNGAMWTIGYEFCSYLFLMLLGFSGLLRDKRALLLLWLAFIGVYFWLRLHQIAPNALHGTVARNFVRLNMFFMAGVVFRVFDWRRHLSLPVILVAAVVTLGGLFFAQTAEPFFAVAGTIVLLGIGFAPMPIEGLRGIPDFSYGIYLYGWPIEKLVIQTWPAAGPYEITLFALVGAACCGALSWFMIEKPALMHAEQSPAVFNA